MDAYALLTREKNRGVAKMYGGGTGGGDEIFFDVLVIRNGMWNIKGKTCTSF